MRVLKSIPRTDPQSREALAARVVRGGALVAGFAVISQTTAHLANRAWLHTRDLNADVEGNVMTWFSGGAVISCGVIALMLAILSRDHRVQFLLLSAAFVIFALDDLMGLHERGSYKITLWLGIDGAYLRALWPLLYFPVLTFVFLALWKVADRAFSSACLAIRLGLAFLVAAVAMEMLWTIWHLGSGRIGDWPDTVEVAIEEGSELGGWILIASGLTAAAVGLIFPGLRTVTTRGPSVASVAVHDPSPSPVVGRHVSRRRAPTSTADENVRDIGLPPSPEAVLGEGTGVIRGAV